MQASLPPLMASKFKKILYIEGEYIHKYNGTLYIHNIRIRFFVYMNGSLFLGTFHI